jgi:hypothetical protein
MTVSNTSGYLKNCKTNPYPEGHSSSNLPENEPSMPIIERVNAASNQPFSHFRQGISELSSEYQNSSSRLPIRRKIESSRPTEEKRVQYISESQMLRFSPSNQEGLKFIPASTSIRGAFNNSLKTRLNPLSRKQFKVRLMPAALISRDDLEKWHGSALGSVDLRAVSQFKRPKNPSRLRDVSRASIMKFIPASESSNSKKLTESIDGVEIPSHDIELLKASHFNLVKFYDPQNPNITIVDPEILEKARSRTVQVMNRPEFSEFLPKLIDEAKRIKARSLNLSADSTNSSSSSSSSTDMYNTIILSKLFSYKTSYKTGKIKFTNITDNEWDSVKIYLPDSKRTADTRELMDTLIRAFLVIQNTTYGGITQGEAKVLKDFARDEYSFSIVNALLKIDGFKGYLRIPGLYGLNNLFLYRSNPTHHEIKNIIKDLKDARLSSYYFQDFEKLRLLILVTVAKGFGAHVKDALNEYGMQFEDYQNLMNGLCSENKGNDLKKFVFVIERFVKERYTPQEYFYWNRCLI